jgi:hypothetical protein
MSTWRIVSSLAVLLLITFVGLFVYGCLANADAITQVRLRLLAGSEEPRDHQLPGFGDDDLLPDYMLRVYTGDRWRQIGTRPNTSAKDWLTFPVTDPMPLRHAFEFQLIEDDKLEDDVLEVVPIIGNRLKGKNFEYEVSTEGSLKSGMEWFFETSVGKAISLGITIGIVVLILAVVGPLLN